MTEDRLRDGGDQAPAEGLGEAGWEPSDWSACVRREQHKQPAMAIGLVVVAGAVLLTGPPSLSDWLLASCLLIVAVVRFRHALRHHSSIGAADRALVTDRARHVATWSKVAFVGWPLLAVVADPLPRDERTPWT